MKIAATGGTEIIKELKDKIKDIAGAELFLAANLNELVEMHDADVYFDFDFTMDDDRIHQLEKLLPKPVFINAVINTLAEIGRPFFRINAWPTFLNRKILEVVAGEGSMENLKKSMGDFGWQYQVVPDLPGMISSRIIATIINEAYFTREDDTSSADDIDVAMKLGTNYPFGPFEWSQKIGLKNIFLLLETLEKTDKRYVVSTLLKKEMQESSDENKIEK